MSKLYAVTLYPQYAVRIYVGAENDMDAIEKAENIWDLNTSKIEITYPDDRIAWTDYADHIAEYSVDDAKMMVNGEPCTVFGTDTRYYNYDLSPMNVMGEED